MNYELRIKNGIENQNIKKILKKTFLFLFFLFIISYGFFRSYNLVFGVKIKNVNMETIKIREINLLKKEGKLGENSFGNILNITGNAKNAVNLMLNGREIPIDKKGNFNESISLLLGYNIISIEAHDKFGKSDKKDYKIIQGIVN